MVLLACNKRKAYYLAFVCLQMKNGAIVGFIGTYIYLKEMVKSFFTEKGWLSSKYKVDLSGAGTA